MEYRRQVGKMIFSNRAWPPKHTNVTDFLNRALPVIKQEGYTAWIHGRTLYDYKSTLDFDMALTGPVENVEKLESLFYQLYHAAWIDSKLILDLKWLSEPHTCELDENQRPKNRNVACYLFGYQRCDLGSKFWETNLSFPMYTPISKDLVKMIWSEKQPAPTKSHQIDEVKKHGRFQYVLATEFLANIDLYL
jgi:hypothetical protein